MKLSAIALLGVSAVAVAQPHHAHVHKHINRRHGSPIEKRADTTVVGPPIETVYELNGDKLDKLRVEEGIRKGIYILVSESATPTSTAAPTPSVKAGEFLEQKPKPSTTSTTSAPVTTSAAPVPTTTSTPEPEPTTEKVVVTPSPSAAPKGGNGVDSDFPSGTIDCSTFPSDYGAIAVDYLQMGGYIGIQKTPSFTPGDSSISEIHTGVAGDSCSSGSFCSYACPAGYQKSQWPSSQGNTGQSIGGIYCNNNGKLELSNPSLSKKLCIKGTGEVKVKNTLSKNVAICRTDYPGTESETVPLNTQPGQEYEMTCPDANNYYRWGTAFTSAQYYINPAGAPVEDACRWNSAGSNLGNWAPVNLGVGKGPAGMTYISIFRNAPTNPDGVLNFNIEITGDVSGKCEYRDQTFWNNGVESASGCTVLVTGVATYKLY